MSNLIHSASDLVSNVGSRVYHTGSKVGTRLQVTGDRWLSPEQRKEMVEKVKLFAAQNPKLAAFLTAQIVLAGIPLLLFLGFALSTLLISLATCVLLGILASLIFTFSFVGFALFFVVPTIFIASCSATFLFVWGLIGYSILRRLNDEKALNKRGTKVVKKIQQLNDVREEKMKEREGDGVSNTGTIESSGMPKPQNGVNLNSSGNGGPVKRPDDTQESLDKWKNQSKEKNSGNEMDNPYQVLNNAETA